MGERNLQPGTLNVNFNVKINLSYNINMIWYSPEVSGKSTARKVTRKQRLNCAISIE